MPHACGLADAFGYRINGRWGAVVGTTVSLWNREDESAGLSPLPDRREILAVQRPKDNFGSCTVKRDFEPGRVLDPFTRHQARLIADVDFPHITKLSAQGLCERLQQFLLDLFCPGPFSSPLLR
ncbi:hypothetical protein NJB1907f22_37810 [Mycobacterium marinum]|nr:hypothetical protein KST_03077 [Mycobacterium marinum]GJO34576.1 hypothetical protein NJB1907f22_37810 [Mycobacterium marinum]